MKKQLLAFGFLLATLAVHSQESTFNVGDKVLNLGIGLGSFGYTGYWNTTIPPISVSGEYGFKDGILEKGTIGIGGYLGYSSYRWDYTSDWYYTARNIIIGARGSFHYPFVDKLDTYTGIMLGFSIYSEKEHGTNIYGYDYTAGRSHPVFSWYAGARYYFSEKFAAFGEFGYGISWLTLGATIKL